MSSSTSPPISISSENGMQGDNPELVNLESLFAEMQPRLLRAARRWAPPEAIDDAVQETWIGVLNGIDRFEGRSRISTWIFGILWRQCCKQWRRAGSAQELDAEPPDLESLAPDADPLRVLEGRESLERIFDVIDDLPARHREIVLLRTVLDQTALETCQKLDLSEANQRVLLYRARTQIRSAVPDLVPG